MTPSLAPAFSNDLPMRVDTAPGSPSKSGGAPPASFQSTYNDVQKSDQSGTDGLSGDPNGKFSKTAREHKETKDPASGPKDPVIAEVAPPPQPAAPPLLFSIPAIGDLTPAPDSSQSKDGASLSSPANASSTDLVGAGLAPETLDIPRLPAGAPQVPNKDLAFALRLLGQDSTNTVPVSNGSATLQTPGSNNLPADSAPPALPVAATLQTPGSNNLPANLAPPALPVAALPRTPVLSTATTTAPLSSAGKDPSTTPQTAAAITPPKIAPVRQPTPNEPSKGNGSDNSGPQQRTADPAPQKAVETKFSAMPLTEVRDATPPANPVSSMAQEAQPLDTRIEAPAPIAKLAQPSSTPANEISVRVTSPDNSNASIRVLDRSGEIRVSVHASDPQLANTLRSDVDELRSHLTTRGWDADVWKPESVATTATRESSNQETSRGPDQNSSGNARDGQSQGQSRQQQNQSGNRPEWMDEFETSLVQGGA